MQGLSKESRCGGGVICQACPEEGNVGFLSSSSVDMEVESCEL